MSVDAAVVELEARGWRVDCYRQRDGGWVVRLDVESPEVPHVSVSRPSLEAAFAAAVAEGGAPLPVYPRRPPVWGAESMRVEKAGSFWRVYTPDGWLHGYPRKRDAVAAIPYLAAQLAGAAAEWDAEVGPKVDGKVEGEDFLWRS